MVESRGAALRSPLSLVVLALLFEAPTHPYRMQKLIQERGQDRLVNVKSRNSIQQTVTRLERDGLIASREPERPGGYPQRVVYALTEAGRDALHETLHELLARPSDEYPRFPAALAFAAILSPGTTADLLRDRRERLAATLDAERASARSAAARLPAILLIENDYVRAMREAEIGWLDRTLDALESGRLTWSTEELLAQPPRHES